MIEEKSSMAECVLLCYFLLFVGNTGKQTRKDQKKRKHSYGFLVNTPKKRK